MRFLFLTVAAALTFCTIDAPSAQAQSYAMFKKTYAVQVQYWFFDTNYYYWQTKFESENQQDAQLMYDLLLLAKQNGQLNNVVPASYWRYIAVDVRLIVRYQVYSINNSNYWQSSLYFQLNN